MREQLHRRLPVEFVAEVRAARNRHHLSKAQACELWGLCQAQLYRLERGPVDAAASYDLLGPRGPVLEDQRLPAAGPVSAGSPSTRSWYQMLIFPEKMASARDIFEDVSVSDDTGLWSAKTLTVLSGGLLLKAISMMQPAKDWPCHDTQVL
jgi:hypothetical protein